MAANSAKLIMLVILEDITLKNPKIASTITIEHNTIEIIPV